MAFEARLPSQKLAPIQKVANRITVKAGNTSSVSINAWPERRP